MPYKDKEKQKAYLVEWKWKNGYKSKEHTRIYREKLKTGRENPKVDCENPSNVSENPVRILDIPCENPDIVFEKTDKGYEVFQWLPSRREPYRVLKSVFWENEPKIINKNITEKIAYKYYVKVSDNIYYEVEQK